MKKTAKLTTLLLALVMSLSLAACSNSPSADNSAPAESQTAESSEPSAAPENSAEPAGDGKYVVGICQLAPHPALDAATEGFIDALNEKLPGQVDIQNKNAAGDTPTCATIVNGFVSDGVDLIMANATATAPFFT